MKSRRNLKKNKKTRKSLKGGFFFSNKVNQSEQCDVNKLTELKTLIIDNMVKSIPVQKGCSEQKIRPHIVSSLI